MFRVELTHSLPAGAHALRREVFMEEQGFVEEFDQTDRTAWHLALYQGEEAVACCRIFPDTPGVWHVGRVAVRKSSRGQGLGAAVMRAAEEAAAGMGASSLVLSAQVQAAGFYEKLGYTRQGSVYLDEHCPHVHMEKQLVQSEKNQRNETICE